MSFRDALQGTRSALLVTSVVAIIGLFAFFTLEPTVGRTATDEFIVQQTITDEVAFLVNAADVTMVGSISGLTGGYATGSTYFVVQTNDPDGYNVTLSFASSSMVSETAGNNQLQGYASTSAADFDWVNMPSNQQNISQFGYSVGASTTADVALAFRDNGSACGAGGSDDIDKCWMGPSTTARTIMNRTSGPAATGATTTLRFKVEVPNNPSPSLPAAVYTATGTLTATNN